MRRTLGTTPHDLTTLVLLVLLASMLRPPAPIVVPAGHVLAPPPEEAYPFGPALVLVLPVPPGEEPPRTLRWDAEGDAGERG